MEKKILRLILGDQLNPLHSWFQTTNDKVLYLLMEVKEETNYAPHHIQKILAIFHGMRSFALHLQDLGHQVKYIRISDKENQHGIATNLGAIIAKESFTDLEYQEPDEYRLDQQLRDFCNSQEQLKTRMVSSEHFLTERSYLREFFKGKKMYLMESFYRAMRKKYEVLMDGAEPCGGKWNYDHDNRQKIQEVIGVPVPKRFKHDVTGILEELKKAGICIWGEPMEKSFPWPKDREEALVLLTYFITQLLPNFGKYQDAMHTHHAFLFHSRISFALNTKMIHPLEVIVAAQQAWEKQPERISISQAEGFIRQILGWREYMRGIYWDKMPEYRYLNFFGHENKLPSWYWTGKTKMNCLKHAIGQSLEHAYAHHIQRLMVTGNFALLAQIHPDEVDKWYLGVYIDAFEWVEITNTRGMSQFADGGIVGTKPYVSSANYIDKMSNYCATCFYDKKKKVGARACPFNSLYWHFYASNREKLEKNPRIGMMYRTWDKMSETSKREMLEQADKYLNDLEEL